jgi:hypothetical protein
MGTAKPAWALRPGDVIVIDGPRGEYRRTVSVAVTACTDYKKPRRWETSFRWEDRDSLNASIGWGGDPETPFAVATDSSESAPDRCTAIANYGAKLDYICDHVLNGDGSCSGVGLHTSSGHVARTFRAPAPGHIRISLRLESGEIVTDEQVPAPPLSASEETLDEWAQQHIRHTGEVAVTDSSATSLIGRTFTL